MSIVQAMVGALVTGLCAVIWGIPGLVVGLLLAGLYYGRTDKQ